VKKRFTEEQIIGFLRARRELVREMVDQRLSERRALAVAGTNASAYRYALRPDRNEDLRQRIVVLAQRHKRYGVGMIHLKLRQAGLLVNYKRVERLYQEAKLQVRRRKRKKVPVAERQPLIRPKAANEVWSMDFVFDRTAGGRVIKCLTVVDDVTHEAVVIEVERAISGMGVTRVTDRLAQTRGLPKEHESASIVRHAIDRCGGRSTHGRTHEPDDRAYCTLFSFALA